MPLQQAVAVVRQYLPRNAVLVGQNISKDVQWLGLREGQDFDQARVHARRPGERPPGAHPAPARRAHARGPAVHPALPAAPPTCATPAPMQMMDLTGLYRIWNERYKSFSVFGQDHLAKVLLGWDTKAGGHDAGGQGRQSRRRRWLGLAWWGTAAVHAAARALTAPPRLSPVAVGDAIKSIRLFLLHQQLQANQEAWQQAQRTLLDTPPDPSFAKLNPQWDGVCMGNRKTCVCGAAFLG